MYIYIAFIVILQLPALTVKIYQTAVVFFCLQLQERAYYSILYGIFLPGVCQVRLEIKSCRMTQKKTMQAKPVVLVT